MIDIIQNVAFPIAISGILLNMLQKEKDSHKNESELFIKAIDNNTRAIERLVDMYERTMNENVNREEIFQYGTETND